jgi:hypothetical protein
MSADRRFRGLWCAALALLVLGVPALARSPQDQVKADLVHVWPKLMGHGYFPLWVELKNVSRERQVVQLDASCGMSEETTTRKTVALEADESRRVELFVPIFAAVYGFRYGGWDGCSVNMRVGGRTTMLGSGFAERVVDADLRTVLVLAKQTYDDTRVEAWSTALSTKPLSTYDPTGKPNDVVVASARFSDQMPTRAEAYTSLDLVVLDLSQGAPDDEALGVLVRWVRLGGRLLVVGEDAAERARALDGLGAWMEDRFAVEFAVNARAWSCGHGVVLVGDPPSAAFESPRDSSIVLQALDAKLDRTAPRRVPVGGVSPGHLLTIPGVGELPYEMFLVLLFAFAVVIGPVNFMVLRRIGKPFLLLVTIPAISAAASLLLFLYGAFSQGFSAKAASSSLTLLDQRSAWASTVEERAAYVPLAPAPGLRPEAGTSIYPVVVDSQRRFVVDLSEGVLLRNGFLPVRVQFNHVALTDRASHLRLSFADEDGGLVVHNELSVPVEHLFLRDPEGATYALREELEPGGAATLARSPELDGSLGAKKFFAHALLGERPLVASSYVAELAGDPFLDDCGVEAKVLSETHALYGVLPERKEDW